MAQEVSRINVGCMDGRKQSPARAQLRPLGLLSVAVLLVTAAVLALTFAARPDVSSGVTAGVEVGSARWAALGEYYTGSRARAADAARWSAQSADYTARMQTIADVNSARWAALGTAHLRADAREADAARWSAQGAAYNTRMQTIADVNSARWSALGEYYARKLTQGK